MKKWLYFVAPLAGLGLFLFFFFAHVEEAKKDAEEKRIVIAKRDKEEADRKAALEARAREDAAKKAAERAAEDKKKEDDRVAKWSEAGKKIEDDTNEAIRIASNHTARIANLDKQIAESRLKKEQLNAAFIEGARQLELAKIARRNAELEVQRLTEFVSKKADESALAKDIFPAPEPKKN